MKQKFSQIPSKFSTGDTTTNEIFYHKTCLKNFNNHCRSAMSNDQRMQDLDTDANEEFQKAFHFNKIISYIY